MSDTDVPTVKGTLTLKIGNISTFMTKIGQIIQSDREQVADLAWLIEARPKVVDNVTYLECYLAGVNAFKWSALVEAVFRIVKKDDGGLGNAHIFTKRLLGNEKEAIGCSRGFSRFITKENLLGHSNCYVMGDSVEIRVDVALKEVSSGIFKEGEALAADIKLVVGNNAFFYLSVVSSIFRDMFAHTEAAEGKKDAEELELKDLDAGEFKEFLGVIYPTRYPITDSNVVILFRIADRYDVQYVVTDCETYLLRVNNVPLLDRLKVSVDLRRDRLRNHLIATMTCDDIRMIRHAENRDQLGEDVLRAVLEKHVDIHHP